MALSAICSSYENKNKTKKRCFFLLLLFCFVFYPPIDPSRCLLIPRLGLSTTSRLIGSGQSNQPGQRDVLAPTGRSQWVPQSPGSLPPPTRVAENGKRAGSPKSFKETLRRRYIVERTNEAEIRLGDQSGKAESCREKLWNKIQVKGP